MKFESWNDEIVPKEIQLDIIDIMNDLKDDIDCRISYQWWPPYSKYDPSYKEGDKYPYIYISNTTSELVENYIKRIRTYLNEQGFNLSVRYDSTKNPNKLVSKYNQRPLNQYNKSRKNSKWKILTKNIDFLTDFKFEIINRDLYGERHPDFKNS